MMRASCHNFKPLAAKLGLVAAAVLAVFLWSALVPAAAVAASRGGGDVPRTGMEGGTRHNFGPEGESRMEKRLMTGGVGVDAYGNPITMEEESAEPRKRPRPGAYGVRPEAAPERPLPDLPPGPSKWKF